MKTAADVLAGGLVGHGVRYIFGMPGSHSTTIYDAIAREGSIRTILMRNEQSAAFAADGYARVTGRPGVICTTAGPGATNALTGVAECWADSVPTLLLSGQVNSATLDRECGNYHEIDLERIFRPATKWCGTVREVDDIPKFLNQAFRAMTTGRPRPAALFLPQDLMRLPCLGPPGAPNEPLAVDRAIPPKVIAEVVELLSAADRPIILAGGGALWSGAAATIAALAERLGAPVITTLNGKGLLDERHPRALGHARSARARHALPHADLMLAVGCRFTEVMTDWRRMKIPRKLVQIDIDMEQIGMNHPVALGMVADAKLALEAIVAALPVSSDRGGWGKLWDEARTMRPAKPEWLIDALRDVLPDDVPVFTDACEMGYRMHADWPSYGPRRFFYPSNYITLGWGFPAALGAAIAREGAPVVSLSGDGGFVMTAQELATAVRYRLPLIALVHNDSTYGAIKNIQDRVHEKRYLDVELNNPDFLQLAAAYQVPGSRVSGPDELRTAVHRALDRGGPTLIEVPDQWRFLRDLATPQAQNVSSLTGSPSSRLPRNP
jgi:thiamine pyrophosphate-dependent acetolactate synthase large subunit-like protein